MRNGLTYTHPGQGNTDIVERAGPIDPEVGVVAAWNSDGQLIGCVVNFACHATTSPGGISANYIYYLERVIRGVMGKDVVVVFTAGASGDVTQVDNLSPTRHPKPEQWARLVGGRVGAEAVKVMLSIERSPDFVVDARSNVLEIRRRVPRPDRVQQALELVQKPRDSVDRTEYTFAKETVLLDAKLAKEPIADVEVQAIQVGPAVFASNPAEYFCQYGLDIKKGSPFPLTFPVSLANGCVGYVPTEEAFGNRGGGYETRLTSYSNLEITAGRQMVDAAIKLAETMKPGPVPIRDAAPPFTDNAWEYGAVPPELE
jgi:neutral ceramidase